MRRVLLLFMMLCICAASAFSQDRVISGQVKDDKGKPVPFASVSVRNPISGQNEEGVSADAQGNFRISVKNASTLLVVSSTGFASKELPINKNTSILSVELGTTTQVIDEVVVTALGIRRNKNLLPYAAQQISGEEVSATRNNNFVSQLSGKVSGIEIRQGNGMGSSTNVVVRGTKSLFNNNQALFVIDGVPVDNSNTTSGATAQGRAVDANGRTQPGNYDYGNAAADINPDDIESVTVLKGAAASALYGSRAGNGVVMVTTKKTRKGLGITVNSGVTISRIDKSTFTKYQKQYGAGYSSDYSTSASGSPNLKFWYKDAFGTGAKSLIVPTTEDASYGPAYDPSLMVYQWDSFDPTSPFYKKMKPWVAAQNDPTSFYQTGVSTNNSVSLSGGDDRTGFKMGYTRNEEKGVLPNSKLIKNLVNLGANYKITDRLTASASLNFSRIDGRGRYGTGYTKFNINQSFRQWWETNVDIKELEESYLRTKQNVTWNWADPTVATGLKPIYSDNPYFTRYQNFQTDTRYRYIGNTSLNYKVTDWLNVLGRVSLDYYSEGHEERVATGSVGVPSYGQYNHSFRELNYDLLANFDKNITDDLNLKALVGTNIRRTLNQSTYVATNGGLVVPNLFALSNSLNALNVLPSDEVAEEIAVDGYFAGLTLGYQNFLTLDATARVDKASTLPVNLNTYFYPSVSGSFLFSKFLGTAPWISSGKIRANYAVVGNSAPWGSLKDVYFKPVSFGSAALFSLPDTKNNPALLPEKTRSKEIGLEMAFFKSRAGFDITYYDAQSFNQIIGVPVSTATGYSFKYVNAGTVQNKGVELSLYASPVRTSDFSWNVNINWTRNRNKVLALFGDTKNVQINPLGLQGGVSINAPLQQAYGSIQGRTWQTLNGQKLIDDKPKLANGSNNANYGRYLLTTTTNNVIGNVNPDWTGGIYNNVKYKNLSLGFLVDMRKGGDVFSLDMYYGLATGVYPESAGLNDKGIPSRTSIAQGGGVIMPGVTSDGKPNTIRVENVYGTYGYSFNPAANFVYDASYVKLREVNLTYTLPGTLVNKLPGFKGIDLSLIARNLWIIHKNLPYADPEDVLTAGNIQGYQSGSYPTNRTMGVNLKLRF